VNAIGEMIFRLHTYVLHCFRGNDIWAAQVDQGDGYRMNARIDGRDASSCSRTGLDWSRHYERTIKALHALPGEPGVRQGHRDPHVHDGLHRPWPSRRVRRPEALASQAVVKLL
jgi:hypothetical protein